MMAPIKRMIPPTMKSVITDNMIPVIAISLDRDLRFLSPNTNPTMESIIAIAVVNKNMGVLKRLPIMGTETIHNAKIPIYTDAYTFLSTDFVLPILLPFVYAGFCLSFHGRCSNNYNFIINKVSQQNI
jgi:hypothetical protein